MDQFYYESGYIVDSYFVYTADAASDQTVTTTVACDATVIAGGMIVDGNGSWMSDSTVDVSGGLVAGGVVAMNSQFSQTVVISHINGADLFAFTEATLAVQVDRIRDNNVAVSGAYTVTASVARTRWISGSMDSAVDITVYDSRVRFLQADMSSAFAIAAAGKRTQQFNSAIGSTSTLSATATRIQHTAAQLNSSAVVSTTAQATKLGQVSLTSQFAQTATLSNVTGRPRQLIQSGSSTFSTDRVVGTHSLSKTASDAVIYNNSNDYNIAAGENFVVEGFIKSANTSESIVIGTYGWSVEQQYVSGSGYRFRFNYRSGTLIYTVNSAFLAQDPRFYWTYFGIYKTGNTLYIKTSQLISGSWSISAVTTLDVTALNTSGTDVPSMSYMGTLGLGSSTSNTVGGVTNFAGQLDEVYFARGTNQLQQFATTGVVNAINVGADSTTQFLFHLDNSFVDDVHGTSLGSASLTSTATVTASGIKNARAQSALSSTATVVINPIKVIQGAATLQCTGFETVVIGKIAPYTAGLDARFTLAANAGRRLTTSVNLNSNFTVAASALDLDLAQAQLTATTALTATGKKTARIAQSLSSTATVSATATPVYAREWPGSYKSLLHLNGNTYDEITKTNKSSSGITGYVTATTGFGTKMSGSHPYVSLDTFNPTGDPRLGTLPSFSIDMRVQMTHGGTDVDSVDLVSFNTFYGNYSLLRLVSDPVTNNAEWLEFGGNIVNSKPYSNNYWATEHHVEVRYTQSIAAPANNTFLLIDGVLISSSRIVSDLTAPLSNMVVGAKPVNFGTRTYSFDEVRLQIGEYFPGTTAGPYQQIQNALVNLNSTTAMTTAGRRLVYGAASLSSNFTQTTVGGKIRFGAATLTSAFVQTTTAQKNVSLTANLSATVTESVTAKKYNGSGAVMSSQFSQTATARKVTVTGSTLTSAFTETVINSRTRSTESSMSSTATMTVSAVKTTNTAGHFDAFVTELAIINRIGRGFIHMDSMATVQAAPVLLSGSQSVQSVETAMTVSALSVNDGRAQLSTTTTINCAPTYLRHTEVYMNSAFTETVNNSRTRAVSAQLDSTASLTEVTTRVRGMRSAMSVTAAVQTDNQIVRLASANLAAEFMIPPVIAGIMVRFEAHLACEGSELVIGDVIHIDPYYQIQIRPETRYYLIQPETRIRVVKSETRVNKIKGRVK